MPPRIPSQVAIDPSTNKFTVELTTKGLYTFTTQSPKAHKGCKGMACQLQPPMPQAFPSMDIDFGPNFCRATGGPAKYFSDVNGAFECSTDPADQTPVLVQNAYYPPITSYSDSRPHTLIGDINMADVDLQVDAMVPFGGLPYPAAVLGGRVTPWNVTRGGGSAITAIDIAPGECACALCP